MREPSAKRGIVHREADRIHDSAALERGIDHVIRPKPAVLAGADVDGGNLERRRIDDAAARIPYNGSRAAQKAQIMLRSEIGLDAQKGFSAPGFEHVAHGTAAVIRTFEK